jgi:outer membrane lipoprotein SlyB
MNNFRLSATVVFIAGSLALGACKPQDATSSETTSTAEETAPATARAEPPSAPAPSKVAAPVCDNCGKVSTVTPVTVKGEGTGIGAAVGAVVGGLAGSQVGGGNGKRLATVVGVAGGAFAGNAIERNRNAEQYFDIGVAMEDGSFRTVSVADASALAVGTPVIVEGETVRLR